VFFIWDRTEVDTISHFQGILTSILCKEICRYPKFRAKFGLWTKCRCADFRAKSGFTLSWERPGCSVTVPSADVNTFHMAHCPPFGVLSLSCTKSPLDASLAISYSLGKAYWVAKLVDVLGAGQSSGSLGMAQVLLGHDKIYRIEPVVPVGRFRVLPRSVLPHTLRDQDRRINSRLRTYSP
jgi:hypothetical protein